MKNPTRHLELDVLTPQRISSPGEACRFFVYQMPMVKGLCILGVITIHVTAYFFRIAQYDWLNTAVIFANNTGRFAVPIFLMLSAYYLRLNTRNEMARPFYRRILPPLLIPYLAYSLFYSLPKLLENRNLLEFAKKLLTASSHFHMWFVAVLCQLFLLHPWLSRVYTRCRHRGLFTAGTLALQVTFNTAITMLFPSSHAMTVFQRHLVMYAENLFPAVIGYFVLGYFLHDRSEQLIHLLRHPAVPWLGAALWLTTTAAMAAYWCIPLSQGVNFFRLHRLDLAVDLAEPLQAVAVFAIIFSLFLRRPGATGPLRRALNSIGLYSYAWYFLNPALIQIGVKLLRAGHIATPHDGLFYVILFPWTVLSTAAVVWALARLPWGRYFT